MCGGNWNVLLFETSLIASPGEEGVWCNKQGNTTGALSQWEWMRRNPERTQIQHSLHKHRHFQREEHREGQHTDWQRHIYLQCGTEQSCSQEEGDSLKLTQRLRCWLLTSGLLPSPPKPSAGQASYWLPPPAPLHPLASDNQHINYLQWKISSYYRAFLRSWFDMFYYEVEKCVINVLK